jgi:indolepyruvate ferredoxin oxidoreductase
MRAVEINGVAVEANKAVFHLGRLAQSKPDTVSGWMAEAGEAPREPETLEEMTDRLAGELEAYQNAAYAEDYRRFVAGIRSAADRRAGAAGRPFVQAVARNLFKLMAYKDEYEVARLLTDDAFLAKLEGEFGSTDGLKFHLAPPLLARTNPRTGEPRKMALGSWMLPVMKGLARMKRLRGTIFDPFGHTAERHAERELIGDYRALVSRIATSLSPESLPKAIEIAELPEQVRGYGHVKATAIEAYRARKRDLLGDMSGASYRTAA